MKMDQNFTGVGFKASLLLKCKCTVKKNYQPNPENPIMASMDSFPSSESLKTS